MAVGLHDVVQNKVLACPTVYLNQTTIHKLSTEVLTLKINAFSDSRKNAPANLYRGESNFANTDLLQQDIASLEN